MNVSYITNKCNEAGMHDPLTATIGNVEAIVPATSLSASFDDWSLYGITEGVQLVLNAQEYCPGRNHTEVLPSHILF